MSKLFSEMDESEIFNESDSSTDTQLKEKFLEVITSARKRLKLLEDEKFMSKGLIVENLTIYEQDGMQSICFGDVVVDRYALSELFSHMLSNCVNAIDAIDDSYEKIFGDRDEK